MARSVIGRISSFRHLVALLAFIGALGLLVGALIDLSVQFVRLQAAPEPEESATVVKIARLVPSPTPTATHTPTITASPTRKPTATSTRPPSPTKKPTLVPTVTPSVVLVRAFVAATVTATVSVSPTLTAAPPVVVGGSFATLPVMPARGQLRSADVNLTIRGFVPISATAKLVDYTGEADAAAPQLATLFSDTRSPVFGGTYQLYDWNSDCNCRGSLMTDYDVSLVGINTSPGEFIRVPESGYEIGNGLEVLVVYADSDRIVLKYTRSDGVIDGYALYLESVSVDTNLIALYQQTTNSGRNELPALYAAQTFGKAKEGELKMAIRDSGAFLDPRSRKDWWRGK